MSSSAWLAAGEDGYYHPAVVASHVAVDTRDGMVLWAGSDGVPFDRAAAEAFAAGRNAEMVVPAYRVFALTEVA
jgi:hypothetical protein